MTNKIDPTESSSLRYDSSAIYIKIMDDFTSFIINIAKKTFPSLYSDEVSVYTKTYDPSMLISSLRTNISDADKQIIAMAIKHQVLHGINLAMKSMNAPPVSPYRGVTGQFVNEGTVRELYRINIRMINDLQLDQIKKIELLLARFLGGGTLTWNQLISGIKSVGEFEKKRAVTIARTEVVRAISIAQKETMLKSGKKHWKWVTASDEKVCRYCGPIDGKVVEIGKPFMLMRGNPITSPPLHPNCRCGVNAS